MIRLYYCLLLMGSNSLCYARIYNINLGGLHPMFAGKSLTFDHANKDNVYFGLFAQWKPIEGGTKFADIARTKAE